LEQLVEWRLAGETEVLGENLPQRHFVHHKIPHDQTRARTQDRRGGKPTTNRLSYGAPLFSLSHLFFFHRCIIFRSYIDLSLSIIRCVSYFILCLYLCLWFINSSLLLIFTLFLCLFFLTQFCQCVSCIFFWYSSSCSSLLCSNLVHAEGRLIDMLWAVVGIIRTRFRAHGWEWIQLQMFHWTFWRFMTVRDSCYTVYRDMYSFD
jgi:hypothetical protein